MQNESLTINHIGKFNVFCICLCSVLAIFGLVIGDEFDSVIGILTLLATVSTGFSFAFPWTILSIMGAQITTFFFLGVGEIIHLTWMLIKVKAPMPMMVLTGLRVLSYFVSGMVGVAYLQKLLESSRQYTAMISKQTTSRKGEVTFV
jgi:hypothetical protein